MWREMRRKKQQLTQQECEAVLAAGKHGILAVLGDEGYPYTVPLDYTYADRHFYFHGAVAGHKHDAIEACDKCSFCVLGEPQQQEGQWWLTWESVVSFGRIHRIIDPDRKRAELWTLGLKYFPSMEGEREHIEKRLAHLEVWELEVEHMTGKLVTEK